MSIDIIKHYFPSLTLKQLSQFSQMSLLYKEWNEKINVISRKDIDSLYIHHILHSLSIAKLNPFIKCQKILDIGTGGGFPGIPLAVFYPECEFVLLDSIGKKINVVHQVAQALNLKNVMGIHSRIEEHKILYNFITARAVTAFPDFVKFAKKNIDTKNQGNVANGIIYLKGGDFSEELKTFAKAKVYPIQDFFKEDFFETKKIIYLPF
jgi:16S rRNA (guanine527-N7)-methyltransferase